MSEKFFQINEKTWVSPKDFSLTENIVYKCKYFFITKISELNRKTPIYYIFKHNEDCIGEIKWYAPWRKFCFYPDKYTVWDNKCLINIVDFTATVNTEYFNNKDRSV